MRHSIKFKLFAVLCVLSMVFVVVLTTLNIFFYDDYYLFQKRSDLTAIYREVRTAYQGDIDAVSDRLAQYENATGVRLTIAGSQNEVKYDSIFRDHVALQNELGIGNNLVLYDALSDVPLSQDNLSEMQTQGYTFVTVSESRGRTPEDQTGFLCLVGFVKNNQELMIARVPLAYVAQSSTFNRTFLVISSLITLSICLLLAYFVSKLFTRPLIKIEEVTNAMAELDFSKKYTGLANDEIGRLGHNINQLSEHLEQAVRALQNTNVELAHEIEEKERIDSMRREFIVNVSHELKTPIAVIQGYAEGLREGVTQNADDRDYYCDTIVDEAGRMNRLVMQLLDLSKLELGRDVPEPTDFNLHTLCQGIVEKTALLANERNLRVDFTHTHAIIWADYAMMEQVVTNYMTNAIRYTPTGGFIQLSAVTEPDGAVTFVVENEGDCIATEDLMLIFEKFYRTDKARTRESGGSGIGLSIVHAIAQAHGGSCGAENTENGVRFWFHVPAKKEQNTLPCVP